MRNILLCVVLCLTPTLVSAQSGSPYMDRARDALSRGLSDIAQWQTTHVINQTVMQCTSCRTPITVVLRHIDGYTKGSDFVDARGLYLEGRKLHCQDLAARRVGRCVSLDTQSQGRFGGITARSIEDGDEVLEFVIPMGPTLLAGYVEGPENAPDLAAIQNVLLWTVPRLSPWW